MASSCESCGGPLHQAARGPKRRFCSDRCRQDRRKVLQVAPAPTAIAGEGVMSRAARAVAVEARRRRTLSAMDEALLTTLGVVADALDRQPGSAALVHEWRGLVRDLRLEAPGQPLHDLAALLHDFRAEMAPAPRRVTA